MKTFYQLVANTVLSSITNMTVWFSITFYTYLQTQSVFATSLISGIYLALTSILGIWFGSLVDHHRKRQMMIISSVFSLIAFLIGLFVYLSAPVGGFSSVESTYLWILIGTLTLGVIAGNIRNIVLPTLVTLLVKTENRDKANGIVGTAGGVGFLVTSAISGFLVGHSGMLWVLILSIITTILAIFHLLMVHVDEKRIVHVEGHAKKIDLKGTFKVIKKIDGLLPLILFSTFNNFLGGVFMSLMDAYGLSQVSVEAWGSIWAVLSIAFIVGGIAISKWGLGKNPLRSLMLANVIIWGICSVFTVYSSIIILMIGMFIYLAVVPYIEASEHTIFQKLVPPERQGRVFGFAQSVEQSASPVTAFAIGPLAQFVVIPFMTTGAGVELIGGWFGTGADRGIALVFTVAGLMGLATTLMAAKSRQYHLLSKNYIESKQAI